MTTNAEPVAAAPKTLEIPRVLSVKELGDLMGVSPVEVIKELMKNGVAASTNPRSHCDTAVAPAEDRARPRRREAIAPARAAGVPIVVALNKIDLENANPDRVKTELSE